MECCTVRNDSSVKSNLKTAAALGTLSAGVQGLLLPSETKAAIKNTIIGQDAFVKNIEKAIPKAEKNFGQKIDVPKAVEYAKKVFPSMKETAGKTAAKLGKTFAAVAVGVFAGEVIADKLIK